MLNQQVNPTETIPTKTIFKMSFKIDKDRGWKYKWLVGLLNEYMGEFSKMVWYIKVYIGAMHIYF